MNVRGYLIGGYRSEKGRKIEVKRRGRSVRALRRVVGGAAWPASEFHGELNARSLTRFARKVVRRGFVPMSRVSAHAAAIATPQSLSRFAPPAASENESISSSIAQVKQFSSNCLVRLKY